MPKFLTVEDRLTEISPRGDAVDGHLQPINRAEQHYFGLVVIQFEEVGPHPLATVSDAPRYLFKEFSCIVKSRFGGKI